MTDDNNQGRPRPERGSSRASSTSLGRTHSNYLDVQGHEQSPSHGRTYSSDNYKQHHGSGQDRVPPPSKSQSSGSKLGLFRKGNRGSRSTTPSPLPIEEDGDDDEWLLEGTSSNGQVNATVSVGREASTLSRSVETLSLNDEPIPPPSITASTSQSQDQRDKRRGSKGRSLAKKTSRLFGRSNGHSNSTSQDDAATASASSGSNTNTSANTLPIPLAGRQSSFSSAGSAETTASSRKFGLVQSGKGSPKQRSQMEIQQPSSWHPPPAFSQRRASSSTQDSSDTSSTQGLPPPQSHPLRHRQSATLLNASVPSLNRHSAPPRAHGSGGQQYTRQETAGVGGRMSSWVSNIFSNNDSSNNSPASVSSDSTQLPPSPLRKGPSAAASFFSGVRNKAVGGMRYLLDSDAQPDQCQETMWVMGVAHPGWSPDEQSEVPADYASSSGSQSKPASPWMARVKESNGSQASPPKQGLSGLFTSSFNLAQQAEPSTPPSDALGKPFKPNKEKEAKWPQDFYDDFRSRVWCTYRNQYAPILSLPQHYLLPNPEAYYSAFAAERDQLPSSGQLSTGSQQSRSSNGPWGWVKGDERGLTSDSGWGCMLRTGQSMLANALITVQLGRDWRQPRKPSKAPESREELAQLEAYAKYVQTLSWFLDDPSPLCPFSVHRMALIGKELGKEVGEWFGPSTAAGALKTLANSFPICGLSVATAVDGTIYRSDVYAASNTSSEHWISGEPERPRSSSVPPGTWGDQAVLILIGIRLGVDGVNPLYYDSIKTLFTFPQSVGIAGGRPSSSYYFVASQANSLFYLDPHFTRPAVSLRVPPVSVAGVAGGSDTSHELHQEVDTPLAEGLPSVLPESLTDRATTSLREGSSASQKHDSDPLSPTQPASPTTPTRSVHRRTDSSSEPRDEASLSPSPPATARHSFSAPGSSHPPLPVDPHTSWYANAYSEAQLQTFHCERVKKLPLSGLDPSMLLGFLCTSEAEFEDFCDRVAKLPQKIFVVQDELPTWSDDDDGALESVSEPASGPEMSDDESISSEHEVSVLAAAEEVDEFGRIGSRPASPGQTIGPMKTPAKASARKSQPEEVVVIPAEPQGDQRPEVDRTVTARPGGLKSNAGSRDVSLGAASEATRADGSEVSSAASADTPIPHRTETDHAAAVSPTPTRSVAEHTAATTPFPPLEPADHVSAISPLPRKTDITSPSHKPRTYSSSSRSLHSRSSSLDNINTEMPLDPRPEVERAVLSRSRSGHSDRGHSRTSSLDHRSELGHAPAAQADEEDDIEMLRPESTDLSNLVESLEPVGGSPRLGGGGFVEALSPQSSPKVVREDDKMPSAGVVIDTGSKDLGLKHHRSHSSTE